MAYITNIAMWLFILLLSDFDAWRISLRMLIPVASFYVSWIRGISFAPLDIISVMFLPRRRTLELTR